MQFSTLFVAAIFTFFAQTMAEPLPQTATAIVACPTQVFHCGGPCGLQCPVGWRCCGPISVEFGGTCYKGTTGVCPL
ncbi:hypothetical protein BYT27DRAFT_6856964 [Phlegmacium glaucopus]|nr:hypothetical protein BYT27DRAFT_6856964 [Phlegmacium glaucopus]